MLREQGAEVTSVALDPSGMDMGLLREAVEAQRPELLYVIPNFQNPAGYTYTEERRRELLEIAAEHDLLVLEDDPYGQLYFDTPPPASLFERGTHDKVIYASSYSKTVSPGLRVGYLVLPEALASAMEKRANNTYISPSLLGQAAVYEFTDAGNLEPNIARCRTMLQERHDAMCDALDELLPEVEYSRPNGGYFLWAKLPGGVTGDELLSVAGEHGVSFVPGSAFGENCDRFIRLAFSYPSPAEVKEGVARLARALSAVPVS